MLLSPKCDDLINGDEKDGREGVFWGGPLGIEPGPAIQKSYMLPTGPPLPPYINKLRMYFSTMKVKNLVVMWRSH